MKTTDWFYAWRRLWCCLNVRIDPKTGDRMDGWPIDVGYCLDRPDSRVEHHAEDD